MLLYTENNSNIAYNQLSGVISIDKLKEFLGKLIFLSLSFDNLSKF